MDAVPKPQVGERLPITVRRDVRLVALITAAFCFWLAVWLAGFAPAVMTPDSIGEWQQTIDGHYRNESPFLHTLTLTFTRKLWDSPSTVILFQTTLLALAFGLSLRSLSRGKPSRIHWLAYAALFFVFPIFAIYAVTIWKDVLFSIGLFLFAIVWVDEPFRARCIGGKWQWACAVGVLLAYVACLRHNGAVLAVLIPVVVLRRLDLPRPNRVALVCGLLIAYLFAQTVLPRAMLVDSEEVAFQRQLTVLQMVSAVVAGNGLIEPEERMTINFVSPLNQLADRYNCYLASSTFLSNPDFNRGAFYDPVFTAEFNRTAATILLRNFPILAGDRACLTAHMLGLGPPQMAYLYETGISANTIGLSSSPIGRIRTPLLGYLHWSEAYPQRLLFWNHVPFLAMLLVAWRIGGTGPVRDVAILLIAISAAMCLFGPARDHRYLFPVTLIAPFLFTHALRFRCERREN